MLKRILALIVSLLWTVSGIAQMKVWALDDCIRYAEEHIIDIQKQSLSIDKSRLDLQEGKWAFVPSLFASSGYTASTGRVLDPTTYQFVQTSLTINSSSSIEGSITLFEGGRKLKILERSKLSLKASLLKEESARYNLKLNVIAAYMDVLCAWEQVAIAVKTAEIIEKQLVRSQNLLEAGSITESDVLQLRSQLFAAENDISSAQLTEKMAKLTLCDLLEIEEYESFSVAEPLSFDIDMTIIEIESAVHNNPDYKVSVLNKSLAEADYNVATSALWPTLSLSVGYGSSWSDARKKTIQNLDGTIRYEAYPFFQQYTDNASAYVSLGLKIPIFSGLSARNRAKRADVAVKEAKLAAEVSYKKVRKQIIQAQMDCDAAWDKYLRVQEEVHYAEEAQRQLSEKYNLGTTDYLSWSTALVESIKAAYSLAESKYAYYLKCETLINLL